MQRRCQIWAILNVTPDSFSYGGKYLSASAAIARAKELLEQGADVLDIGGASSRPPGKSYGAGAPHVDVEEELRRVMPVIEPVVRELGATVSIDTTRPEVARAALRAGARIVNDVSTGSRTELLEVVAEAHAELVLMHNRGDGSMNGDNASYGCVVDDVVSELTAAAARAIGAGVAADKIWLDPGVGFAKRAADSVAVMAGIPQLLRTGYRVLIGPSRKSFIAALEAEAQIEPQSSPDQRIAGTAAAVAWSVWSGAHAVRVHDVAEMRQTILVSEALQHARAAHPVKEHRG
jgi:dihydropteroate synthase